MDIDFAALIPFAFITTFSPGPNNVMAAATSMRFGYRRTMPLLFGICCGFFGIFVLCMAIAFSLQRVIDRFGHVLSIVGALYILWLAYHTYRASHELPSQLSSPPGFVNGMLLQLMNPKVIIYGLTLFSTFLSDIPKQPLTFVLVPMLFALLSLASTTTWALAGTSIARFMRTRATMRILNATCALLLVLIAIDLSGVRSLF